jgi:hypothetical protein
MLIYQYHKNIIHNLKQMNLINYQEKMVVIKLDFNLIKLYFIN